ncbi:MAG: amidase family protein, partial [Steroidobacteraceae bacterium]
GTAAAIAAGVVPAGLGTDTAGSVRMPASLCGIAGLRPTLGRYPTAGVLPLSHTRDTVGPMGRTATDVAWMDSALRGVVDPIPSVSLRGVRLGLLRDVFYHELDPMTEQVIEQALKKLEEAGAELIEISGDEIRRLNEAISGTLLVYEMIEDIPAYLRTSARGVEFEFLIDRIYTGDLQKMFRSQLAGHASLEPAYRKALDVQRPQLIAACDALFRDHRLDAFVLPATPLPARPITQSDQVEFRGASVSASQTYTRNADIASNIGLPGLCVCAGLTPDGLPVGIEFDGPPGKDRQLLGLGVAFEQIRGVLPAATSPRI